MSIPKSNFITLDFPQHEQDSNFQLTGNNNNFKYATVYCKMASEPQIGNQSIQDLCKSAAKMTVLKEFVGEMKIRG